MEVHKTWQIQTLDYIYVKQRNEYKKTKSHIHDFVQALYEENDGLNRVLYPDKIFSVDNTVPLFKLSGNTEILYLLST